MKRQSKKSRNHGSTRKVRQRKSSIVTLREPNQLARDRALHVLAAMRHDPNLSLTHAAKLEGVKPETVKKYFSSALKKENGKFQATKSDRYGATLYVPDANGHAVPVRTRSSRERTQLGQYFRDLSRYSRGKRGALSKWDGKKIAGVALVTDARTIASFEPALSDFSLYRSFNSGRE